MNPRHWFIALAVALPLALFGAAKWATRWRPIAIGRVDGASGMNGVSNHYLSIHKYEAGSVLFDLNTGAQTNTNALSGVTGDWIWSIETRAQPHLTLTKGDTSVIYRIRRLSKRKDFDGDLNVSAFVIAPERNCVQLLLGSRYYQWNLQSRQLEREFQVPIIYGAYCAFSRDGKTLVEAGRYAVATFSTRTGRTLTYRPGNPKLQFGMATFGISTHGSYIFADNPGGGWDVEEARTGRVLWQLGRDGVPVFSPDETLTAQPLQDKGIWEIRETKTGRLVRTLAAAPGTSDDDANALSPDNSTLYYVFNGVIYQQRAQ